MPLPNGPSDGEQKTARYDEIWLGTEDISQKIQLIQSNTQEAVQAIGRISGIIGRINDVSNTIASAVESSR